MTRIFTPGVAVGMFLLGVLSCTVQRPLAREHKQQLPERLPTVQERGERHPIAVVPVLESPPTVTPASAERRRPTTTDSASGLSAFDIVRYNASYHTCFDDQQPPRTLSDLDGGYNVFYYSLTETSAIQLSVIPVGSATRNKRSAVHVYRFLQYTERPCDIGGARQPVIWGVGAQAILHVRSAKRGVNLTRPSVLAAAVELNRAEVTFSMDVLGVTGSPVRKVLPEAGAFHVENYAKMVSAIDQVRALLDDPGVTIRPKPLGTRKEFGITN